MAPFEQLQQLWQQQPARPLPPGEAAELRGAFQHYGRRHDLLYVAKAIFVACQFVFLVSTLRHNRTMLLGALLVDFSAIYFMVHDWRTQRAIARLNFAAPSMEFVRAAIARLQAQRNPFHTRQALIAGSGCWLGFNVMIAGHWYHWELRASLTGHAVALGIMVAAYLWGRWIRRKRFDKQCRPLISRLEQVLQTMEANRV